MGYASEGVAHESVGTADVILEVGPRGQALFGSGGCNRYRATVLLSENGLALGSIVATRMACAEDVTRQEQVYFTLLQRASAFTVADGELLLESSAGSLSFSAQ